MPKKCGPSCSSFVARGVGVVPLMKSEFLKRDIIHQHMVSHYRRLYNAKSTIDTSQPMYFKPHFAPRPRPCLPTPAQPVKTKLTSNDLGYIREIVGEKERDWPPAGTDRPQVRETRAWIQSVMMSIEESPRMRKSNITREVRSVSVSPVGSRRINMTRPLHQLESNTQQPKMLEHSNFPTSSRLREMSVYHPPRRRLKNSYKEPNVPYVYCAGCLAKLRKQPDGKLPDVNELAQDESMTPPRKVTTFMGKPKDDLLYLQFIQDITQDILSNGVYTNNGLEEIFKKHIKQNKGQLQMSRMMNEIHKLKIKLDVPIDNSDEGEMKDNFPNEAEITPKKSSKAFQLKETKTKPSSPKNKVSSSIQHMECKTMHQCSEKEKHAEQESKCTSSENEEDKVLNLLQDMGFDMSTAQEIFKTVSDKNIINAPFDSENTFWFGKSKKTPSEASVVSKNEAGDSDKNSPLLEGEGDVEPELQPAIKEKTSHQQKTQPTQKSQKSEECTEVPVEVFGGNKASGDGVDNTAVSNPVNKIDAVPKNAASSELKRTSQSDSRGGEPAPGGPSPIASDYSSMKDHDESVCESSFTAEEPDEGRESGSEVEEDIPEDISVASSSSDLSLLVEKLKHFKIDSVGINLLGGQVDNT